MSEFYTGDVGIHGDSNRMWLRADLHRLYEAHSFAIVPKREIFDPGEPQPHSPQTYVVHFLGASVGEFWDGYHKVPAQHIEGTRPQLHLARFAWIILICVKGFLLKGYPRTVARVLAEDGEQKTETLAGSDLTELYGGGDRLYASPWSLRKKRKADDEEEGVL
ncbi:uncharacterized protein DNG_07451 [Cephalotrichum gorgonifer]|uniref:HNH nuclease domain-containing protein n=1 Tax=Cephalotrichum gorgonifer TaxID=2041049 RepID=A0AAE8N1N4_9PEZI|nr:uncharacterized protein DNG_07451 [Cephalotrichum gorgonifer]